MPRRGQTAPLVADGLGKPADEWLCRADERHGGTVNDVKSHHTRMGQRSPEEAAILGLAPKLSWIERRQP